MVELGKVRDEINRFFEGLQFEDNTHTYTYNNLKLTSVSSVIKQFVEEVDFDQKAEAIAKREGVSKQDVLDRWSVKTNGSIVKGKSVHAYAETDMSFEKDHMYPEDKALVQFWDDLHPRYKPVKKEAPMYHKKFFYCGTPDLPLYDEITDTFILADYKTNENLFKNYKGKRLLPPFQDLKDMPFNKYQIQLCLYQMLFEQIKGVTVSDRWLIHLRPDATYKVFSTYDFTDRLKQWMKDKKFCTTLKYK